MVDQYDMEEIEVHGKSSIRNRTNRSNLSHDADRTDLANIGKKEVLKRRFGFMSMIGFSCTLMGTWAGLLTFFAGPLTNGGSAGSVYGYIFGWLGVLTVMCTLAELASMAPTAGGQVRAPCKFFIKSNSSLSTTMLRCSLHPTARKSSRTSRAGQQSRHGKLQSLLYVFLLPLSFKVSWS